MRDREMELLRKILRTRKGLVITLRWADEPDEQQEQKPEPEPQTTSGVDPEVLAWAREKTPLLPR